MRLSPVVLSRLHYKSLSLCDCYKVDIVYRCNRAPMKAYEYVKDDEPTLENPDLVISDSDSHK